MVIRNLFLTFLASIILIAGGSACAAGKPSPEKDPSYFTGSYVKLLDRIINNDTRGIKPKEITNRFVGLMHEKWGKRVCFFREIDVHPGRAAAACLSSIQKDLFLAGFVSISKVTVTGNSEKLTEITSYLGGLPFYILKVREIFAARVSFIIDDVGYNEKALPAALAIKCPVDFSVLPRLAFSKKLAIALKKKGFEIMLHLPMESESKAVEQEKVTIKAGSPKEMIKKTIDEDLDEIPGVVGINNHMGSKATKDEAVMVAVLSETKAKGVFFVDSMTSNKSAAGKAALKAGVKIGERDVFLDNKKEPKYVKKQIERLKTIALAKKKAIGIGHFHPVTLKAIEDMRPELEEAGIKIVFVSELLQ